MYFSCGERLVLRNIEIINFFFKAGRNEKQAISFDGLGEKFFFIFSPLYFRLSNLLNLFAFKELRLIYSECVSFVFERINLDKIETEISEK